MAFKTTETEKLEKEKIQDKYRIVYVLFSIFGIIHFLPGTYFVTAQDYWMYKFRNVSSGEVDPSHRTYLQAEFSASVTIATHVGAVCFSFLTLLFGYKFSTQLKLYGSLSMILILYIIAAIFIHVDADDWQDGFFAVSMLIVAGINGMTSIFGLTSFTIIAKFPDEYLGSCLNGQGVAGLFTSILQILSLSIGISTTNSALFYFWLAIGLLFSSMVSMFLITRYNRFYQSYHSNMDEEPVKRKTMSFKQLFSTLKILWKSQLILFFHLWTVNPTHPAVTSLVVSEGQGDGEWNDVYFVPTITFVLVALCDYIGRVVTIRMKSLADVDGIWFVAFSAARIFIFVPLFLLCNAQPRTNLPVVFHHDYEYIIIITVFALSNGFLLSIGNLILPKTVPPDQLENAYHVNLVGAGIQLGTLSFLGFVSVKLL